MNAILLIDLSFFNQRRSCEIATVPFDLGEYSSIIQLQAIQVDQRALLLVKFAESFFLNLNKIKIEKLNSPFSVDVDLDPDVRVICRDFIRGVCGRKL